MAQDKGMMGTDFRNRLKDGRNGDPEGVYLNGQPGWLDFDGNFVADEENPDYVREDPDNDERQEWTFVRDASL